jgi:hypothetical protein
MDLLNVDVDGRSGGDLRFLTPADTLRNVRFVGSGSNVVSLYADVIENALVLSGGQVFVTGALSQSTFVGNDEVTFSYARVHNSIVVGAANCDNIGEPADTGFVSSPGVEYSDGPDFSGSCALELSEGTGNVAVAPLFVSYDPAADPSLWDLTLRSTSPLRDAGDPAIFDADGTRSDMGAYGGPYGASW